MSREPRNGQGAIVGGAVKDRLAEPPGEPPVVARLMVEIRSDGTRTVARGALEDLAGGETAAVEARGTTPAALAASLLKSLVSGPLLARVLGRALQLRGR
jgi:hypothetical protein